MTMSITLHVSTTTSCRTFRPCAILITLQFIRALLSIACSMLVIQPISTITQRAIPLPDLSATITRLSTFRPPTPFSAFRRTWSQIAHSCLCKLNGVVMDIVCERAVAFVLLQTSTASFRTFTPAIPFRTLRFAVVGVTLFGLCLGFRMTVDTVLNVRTHSLTSLVTEPTCSRTL